MAECKELLSRLKGDDNEALRQAAFQAGEEHCHEAVPLLAALLTSDNLGVQEAADRALRAIGGKDTVHAVLPLLASDEAPARNLSMDILRQVGVEDVSSILDLLHSDDADMRIFAADILGSTKNSMAVQPLCDALLKDPEVNVRYQAAVSLGDLGMREAAECLNKAIDDEEWVQYSVIEALAKLGDSSSVDALVKAMDKSSDLVASMIVDALGEMGNLKAVTMLLGRMEDSPTALRNKIVRAIVHILGGKSLTLLSADQRERFREYMLVALEDDEVEVQDAAIQGLSFVGGEDASAGVLCIAAGLNPDVDAERLRAVVQALAKIGVTQAVKDALAGDDPAACMVAAEAVGLTGSDEGKEALKAVFWDKEQNVRREFMNVLAEQAGPEDKDFFLDVLDNYSDAKVLKGALGVLGRMELSEVGGRIFELLGHEYDDVKEAALEACIAINGPEMTERFLGIFDSDNPVERLMATYALGKLGASEHLDRIKTALEDEIPDIRKVALEALAGLCTGGEDWLALAVSRLNDENRDVRLTVVELMGGCFTPEVTPFLIQALNDHDDWVCIRALDALGAQRAEEAVRDIVPLLESSNRLVVMKSIEALGSIGGTAAFRALLDISDSDDPEVMEAAGNAVAKIQAEQEEEG